MRIKWSLVQWLIPIIPVVGRLRLENHYKFKASLVWKKKKTEMSEWHRQLIKQCVACCTCTLNVCWTLSTTEQWPHAESHLSLENLTLLNYAIYCQFSTPSALQKQLKGSITSTLHKKWSPWDFKAVARTHIILLKTVKNQIFNPVLRIPNFLTLVPMASSGGFQLSGFLVTSSYVSLPQADAIELGKWLDAPQCHIHSCYLCR